MSSRREGLPIRQVIRSYVLKCQPRNRATFRVCFTCACCIIRPIKTEDQFVNRKPLLSVSFARRCVGAILISTALVTLSVAVKVPAKPSAAPKSAFTITPLILPNGTSEPEISIGLDGTMGMVSLQWLFDPSNFGTDLWTGPFGSTPTFQGVIDAALQHPGKSVFGAGDADVDMGASGRLHATTLIFLLNPTFNNAQLGVSAITCPSPASGFSIGQCTGQNLHTTQAGPAWVPSKGPHGFIFYQQFGNF